MTSLNVIVTFINLLLTLFKKESVYKSLWGLTLVKPYTNVFIADTENIEIRVRSLENVPRG